VSPLDRAIAASTVAAEAYHGARQLAADELVACGEKHVGVVVMLCSDCQRLLQHRFDRLQATRREYDLSLQRVERLRERVAS
jgi:hypothetical protein